MARTADASTSWGSLRGFTVGDARVEVVISASNFTGTVARTGIPGLVTGNTAELILNHVRCPVLALKPTSFVSPVSLGG